MKLLSSVQFRVLLFWMRCSDSFFDSFSLLHMFHAEDLTASLQKSSYVGEEDNVVDVNEAVGAIS